MKHAAGLLVALLALCANAWMLGLEFQYCDYDDIPDVGWMLGVEPVPEGTPGGPSWLSAIRIRVYSFRPALWTALLGLRELSGPVARPWLFHGFFLAAHALASFLLFRLIAARLDTRAGFVGGALFAILPGGIQAVSWITAGGDQLAVLFMLVAGVAGDRALRTRSRGALVACAAAAACAVASKETAVVLLPALAFLWAVPFSGDRVQPSRSVAPCLAAGVGAAAAWIARSLVLGIWLPEYWSGARLESTHAREIGSALRGFLVPWAPLAAPDAPVPASARLLGLLGTPADQLASLLAAIVAGAALAAIVGGAARAAPARKAAIVILAGLFLLVLGPVLPLVDKTGLGLSRALYQAALLLAALVAAAVGPRGRGRGLAMAWTFAFAILSIDLLACVARAELRMAKRIAETRADLAGCVESRPAVRFIVLDPPGWLDHVPFLGSDLVESVRPPFGRVERPPLHWPAAELLPRCAELRNERAPVQILEWSGGRISPRGPLMGPIPDVLPALEPDGADAGLFLVRSQLTPRAVGAVRVGSPGSAPPPSGRVILSAGTRSMTLPFQGAVSGPLIVTVPDPALEDDWYAQPSLSAVRIEGAAIEGVPELVRSPPSVHVTPPKLTLSSVPRIAFASDAPAASFRITLMVLVEGRPVDLAWTAAAAAVPRGADGTRVFAADAPGSLSDGARTLGNLSWAQAAAHVTPKAHGRLWSLPGGIRVEALDASGVNVIARSEWLMVFVSR